MEILFYLALGAAAWMLLGGINCFLVDIADSYCSAKGTAKYGIPTEICFGLAPMVFCGMVCGGVVMVFQIVKARLGFSLQGNTLGKRIGIRLAELVKRGK